MVVSGVTEFNLIGAEEPGAHIAHPVGGRARGAGEDSSRHIPAGGKGLLHRRQMGWRVGGGVGAACGGGVRGSLGYLPFPHPVPPPKCSRLI